MARSCGEEKWEGFNFKEDEFEEEALSFCDLPAVKEKPFMNQHPKPTKIQHDDFHFSHCVGNTNPTKQPPQMCAADEVFFQGQILPLRLSFSSENSNNNLTRNLSTRSESMDHNKFRNTSSSSSRSSSSRSGHYSRSSSNSNNSISISSTSKPRASNNLFHSLPSPKPQIRSISSSRHCRSSSRWDFFRLGLVRTPEMELQDLKNRSESNKALLTMEMEMKQKTGILSVVSCKRSVETVDPLLEKIQMGRRGIREKVNVELKMMRKQKQIIIHNEKEKEKDEGERLSHRRTFEWIKQLSHASLDV